MHINLGGLVPILCGIFGLLIVYRFVPIKPNDPEKMELWHRKFDKIIKVVSPILIGYGLLQLVGIL
jgi:hypothetical protein